MYKKSGMEVISVHANCGGEELNNFFCRLFVYNLLVTLTCATNKFVWCRLKYVIEFGYVSVNTDIKHTQE